MNVYIWNDNPLPYEYSYDFKNKNYSTVVNDWWNLRSWTNQSRILFDSNKWISSQSWGWMYYNLGSDKMTNAKKVTITCWLYLESTSQLWVNLYSNTSRWNPALWSYIYNVGNELNINLWNETKKEWWMTSSWNLQWTAVYDLINKTAVLNYTQGSSASISWTLTDSSIASIRWWCNYIWFVTWQSWGTGYWTTIYVKIE